MTDEEYIQSLLGLDIRQGEIDAILEIIGKVKAENAALRERFDKAVELPCKLRDKLYYVNEYLDIPKINEYTVTAFTILPECIRIYVGTGDYFLLDDNVCFTPEAAEARLKEMQGGEE